MARPAPHHVNQFDAGGRFPLTAPVSLRGKPSGPYDCMVACGVMDLDAATAGAIVLTTSQLRARQSDQDRSGIGLNDVSEAHRNTPGAPALSYGTKAWPSVAARFRAGDGGIVAGYYIALGASRASSFTGAHALYVQRIDGRSALVNDPIRRAPAWIPTLALQRFYLSGIGQAGWSAGSSSGVSTPAAGGTLGAWNNLVTFPIGYVITVADVDRIMAALEAAGWFAGQSAAAGAIASYQYRQILLTAVGQPWTKALQDQLAARAAAAASAASDPFGIASGLQGIVAGFSEVFRNGILLVAILALVIMGLWLVATATDNALPIPRPRISIGA